MLHVFILSKKLEISLAFLLGLLSFDLDVDH